jgi:hypothetical protein
MPRQRPDIRAVGRGIDENMLSSIFKKILQTKPQCQSSDLQVRIFLSRPFLSKTWYTEYYNDTSLQGVTMESHDA